MKLFVDTILARTEVDPNKNGTIPQYYAYCIQSASDFLNNSNEGIKKARDVFIRLMKEKKQTENMIKGNTTLLYIADSDAVLQRAMSGYVVSSHLPSNSELYDNAPRNNINEHYTYCIDRAKKYLNNTEQGLVHAKASFLNDMKALPETAVMVEGIRADLVLYANNDKDLLRAISGYTVFSDSEDNKKSNITRLW